MDEMILVKDLPKGLIDAVTENLTSYTIAFLRVEDAGANPQSHLAGSGVLVSAGSKRAILTAYHVVADLPATGRVGLFLGRTTQPHTMDAQGISVIKIGRGSRESDGPDLAVVVIAPQIAGAIEAKKLFYSLDIRRERLLYDPPGLRDGAWFAQGFVEERTTGGFDSVEEGFTKYFYNSTGAGGPENLRQVDEYDYFDFPVDHDSRANAPEKWNGMSGGGIWQVPFKKQEGGLLNLPPLLSGTMFYQRPTTETECGVRAHGRRSIYEMAYGAILNREPERMEPTRQSSHAITSPRRAAHS